MAVEAARNAQSTLGIEPSEISSLVLASTSLPFSDRSNSGLLREALNLDSRITQRDSSGSRKAAVSELIALSQNTEGKALLCSSDCVDALPASDAELATGHGAAALVYGPGNPLATVLGHSALQEDFVDQYRMSDQRHSYQLEARWTRDAGIRPQFSAALETLLETTGEQAENIDWLLAPVEASQNRSLIRDGGLKKARSADVLMQSIGHCGAAHPLVMLAWALEQAEPGDRILLAGLGQGCELVLLEVRRKSPSSSKPVQEQIDSGRLEENYTRYLGLRKLLPMDTGIRSERDNRTSQSAYFRRHSDINGFIGGLCSACGKKQFPRSALCVHCQAADTQSGHSLANLVGEINSFTEDWLAYSPRPPLMFGNVHFPGGANVMMEFSDFLPGELQAGMPVRMSFRIKDFDSRRNFRRYFWKPTPMQEAGDHG